jgi:hypothetical protein
VKLPTSQKPTSGSLRRPTCERGGLLPSESSSEHDRQIEPSGPYQRLRAARLPHSTERSSRGVRTNSEKESPCLPDAFSPMEKASTLPEAVTKRTTMAIECGSEPIQTAVADDADQQTAYTTAREAARQQAQDACAAETCPTGQTCFYTETKLVGKTTYDQATQKWTSTQTTSGKCSCKKDDATVQACNIEVEQTVMAYDVNRKGASESAQAKARRQAEEACSHGKCPPPVPPAQQQECKYKETRIEGSTKHDSVTNKYVATQTSVGKCHCA